jgi:hypothetical protein
MNLIHKQTLKHYRYDFLHRVNPKANKKRAGHRPALHVCGKHLLLLFPLFELLCPQLFAKDFPDVCLGQFRPELDL